MRTSWTIRLGGGAAFGCLILWSFFSSADIRAFRKQFVTPGMNRILVRVFDAQTRAPLAARVSFTDSQGEYYPPYGHPRKIPAGPWGGDLALPNGKNHAYVDGTFETELPSAQIRLQVSRGFEYDVFKQAFLPSELPDGILEVPLRRWVNMEEKGWYPGDTHIHFPNPQAAYLEMRAEGLRVTNLLVYKSGLGSGERDGEGTFKNVEHFDGRLNRLSDKRYFLYTNEEFRNHFLGHLIFLNLRQLVWPVSTGEVPENGWGGYDWPTHADAAQMAKDQDGLVIWAHFPYPNGECPVDVALGKIDAFDILTTGNPFKLHPTLQRVYKMYGPKVYDRAPIDLYYDYLNCGFHISASAGSDKMNTSVPMGSARVYVQSESGLDYQSWIDGIRKGKTFISTGPMIELSAEGQGPGGQIHVSSAEVSDGRSLRVRATSRSRMPYEKLEIIQDGRVVAEASPSGEHFEAALDAQVSFERSGWVAARCYGAEMLPYGGPPGHWFRMPVFAHTSPLWVSLEGHPPDPGEAPARFLEQIQHHRDYVLKRGRYGSEKDREYALRLIQRAEAVYRKLTRTQDADRRRPTGSSRIEAAATVFGAGATKDRRLRTSPPTAGTLTRSSSRN